MARDITNSVKGYNRQLRKIIKSKGEFPSGDAAMKLLFLAYRDITKKWPMPLYNWPLFLNDRKEISSENYIIDISHLLDGPRMKIRFLYI